MRNQLNYFGVVALMAFLVAGCFGPGPGGKKDDGGGSPSANAGVHKLLDEFETSVGTEDIDKIVHLHEFPVGFNFTVKVPLTEDELGMIGGSPQTWTVKEIRAQLELVFDGDEGMDEDDKEQFLRLFEEIMAGINFEGLSIKEDSGSVHVITAGFEIKNGQSVLDLYSQIAFGQHGNWDENGPGEERPDEFDFTLGERTVTGSGNTRTVAVRIPIDQREDDLGPGEDDADLILKSITHKFTVVRKSSEWKISGYETVVELARYFPEN